MQNSLIGNSPLVSVILPVYNGIDTIDIALQSLLNQSYKNMEIIVIDDGSSDGTAEYIGKKYTNQKRVKLFCNESNIGLCRTLNVGIDNASGDYIARADADDFNLRARIETQVDYLENNKEVDVIGSAAYLTDTTNKIYGPSRLVEVELNESDASFFKPIFYHPSVMARSKFFLDVGSYDARYPRAEDLELWIRGIKNGARYHNLPEPLIIYNTNNYKRTFTALIKRSISIIRISKKYSLHYGYVFCFTMFVRSLLYRLPLIRPASLSGLEVDVKIPGYSEKDDVNKSV